MTKLNITKEDLLNRYKIKIDKIADECEWKSIFSSLEICGIICGIIFETDGNIYNPRTICDLYLIKVDELNLDKGEWVKTYGMPEIVSMVYDTIEEI
jgi:hypothetical protein